MSLEMSGQSAPQSDPQGQPQGSPPAGDPPTTLGGGAGDDLGTPKPGVETMGGNGGPDWRAMLAGEDTKAIETLSRYKTPADLLKTFNEQRTALSKRAEPVRLADNATPEQIGEYRKGMGLPDVAADAKPEAFMEAFKISMPEGYTPSEMEKGMIADYAKDAYAKGFSPREVKESVNFFVKQNMAQQQAVRAAALNKQKEWQGSLRDELGSKEYDAQVGAAGDWLRDQFADNPEAFDEIRTAMLPSGGRLGDHPWFIKLIAQQAMGAGYTDRIEANALESGGKSLALQQQEIEKLRTTDRAQYNLQGTQEKLKKIISARSARGEIDEWGNERKRS